MVHAAPEDLQSIAVAKLAATARDAGHRFTRVVVEHADDKVIRDRLRDPAGLAVASEDFDPVARRQSGDGIIVATA